MTDAQRIEVGRVSLELCKRYGMHAPEQDRKNVEDARTKNDTEAMEFWEWVYAAIGPRQL